VRQIDKLLDEHESDGVLRYMTLPGVDLLDLRHVYKAVCEPRSMRLRFLGFNRGAQPASPLQTELNISLDEVRRLGGVEPISDVVGDDYTRLANEESLAWKRARDLGPFDVVNLDLCDGFAAPKDASITQYDALTKILALQSRHSRPWLLLMTTRVGPEHVDTEVLEAFLRTYLANLDCEEFVKSSAETFGISDADSLSSAASTPEGLLTITLCGLCKWLAGLAAQHQPPTRVELKSAICYRVRADAEVEDLFSVALRLTPTYQPASDPARLARVGAGVADECATAVKIVRRVAKRVDADAVLDGDADLLQSMIDGTADLLTLARYDADAYVEWVRSQRD
jgi:hypothetical protein